MPPPEASAAMLILRGLLREDALSRRDYLRMKTPCESLDKDAPARMTYWAIRFALSETTMKAFQDKRD